MSIDDFFLLHIVNKEALCYHYSEKEGDFMKITFIGAAHEVTGSCTLVETGETKFLVDCGMEQGPDIYENRNLPVSPTEIDFLFLTHAHIDHSGKLPLLVKSGFRGKIYTTDATRRLCSVMLADSAHIQMSDAEWKNRKAKRSGKEEYEPLYDQNDVNRTMALFESYGYDKEFRVSDGVSAKFFDAGHLLGSSSVKLRLTEYGKDCTVIFSGDIGNSERPLLRDPQMPDEADVVITESTYGDRIHDSVRPDYEKKLTELLTETFERGGNLVIPSFAVGRTQELLYLLRGIKERHAVKYDFPVYLDSPLAVEATKIYSTPDMRDYYDDETLALLAHGVNPITFDGLHISVTTEDSKAINTDPTPKVIIASSGMCEAGRIRHHLKYNLWRKECTVLFIGYQVEGTLGRRLLNGEKTVNLFGDEIRVEAKIDRLDGISAHADKNGLLRWLGSMKKRPRRVYVNHGDDPACEALAKAVNQKLTTNAVAPYSGGCYDLLSDICYDPGNTQKLQKRSAPYGKSRASVAWTKLFAAGVRLSEIIEKSRGMKSKELMQLTNQVNSLCNKWGKTVKNKKKKR